jgi:hypothetical protein
MDARLSDATRKTGIFRRPTYGYASFLTQLCGFVRLGSKSTNPLDVRRFPKGPKSGIICYLEAKNLRIVAEYSFNKGREFITANHPQLLQEVTNIIAKKASVLKLRWCKDIGFRNQGLRRYRRSQT